MDSIFGKSDPYFKITRTRGDNEQELTIYGNRKNHIKKTLDPVFPAFTIEAQKLCNCDPYTPITIKIYDWDSGDVSKDDFIGEYTTNLNELKQKPKGLQLTRKAKSKKNKSYGTLNVVQFSSEPLYGFLDYLQGGAEISLMTAIDFTGSNGHPKDKGSLHYLEDYYTKGQPSRYQKAIRQIGNIVSVYDFDKKFPVWGFGAWFNSTKIVYHGFALNQLQGFGQMIQKQIDVNNPEVLGLYEMELAYLNAVKLCTTGIIALSGPTLFEEILEKARRLSIVAHNADNLQYNILVILTDGIINDMPKTKDKIVEISNTNLPLSIIIIGIGDADFSKMDELDGDDGRLKNSKGVYAKRDIVQFVPMKKYENNMNLLSSLTLQEIPSQFLSYVKIHNIKPGKKPSAANVEFAVNDEVKEENIKELNPVNGVINDYDANQDPYFNAPLPHGWERGYADNGRPYYVNNANQTTQWEHPNTTSAAK